MSEQFWWYLARASGLTAWALMSFSVLWGLLASAKPFGRWPRAIEVADLHRWLASLTVAFTALHLGALVADSWIHIDLVGILVPFAADWRPAALVWGVFALWGLLAVQLTSVARTRLPRRAWRIIHLSAYLSWWMATMHAATVGTDATHPAWRIGVLVTVSTMTGLLVHRLLLAGPGGRRPAGANPRTAAARATTAPQTAAAARTTEGDHAPFADAR